MFKPGDMLSLHNTSGCEDGWTRKGMLLLVIFHDEFVSIADMSAPCYVLLTDTTVLVRWSDLWVDSHCHKVRG